METDLNQHETKDIKYGVFNIFLISRNLALC